MFNRVSSFQESERELLYAARSRGSDCGPIRGWRHPVEQDARTKVAKASGLVMVRTDFANPESVALDVTKLEQRKGTGTLEIFLSK
jgi:hypothetical protein